MVSFVRHFFPELPSTQSFLRGWASQAALPEGTLVWTLRQTEGYGRKGTPWYATPGESLTFSFFLRPRCSLDTLTPRAALALYDAIAPYTQKPLFLKWPNDLWCPQGKLAGILTEVVWDSPTPQAFIGIGLNVYQKSFPPGLPAASLSQVGNPPPHLSALLDDFEQAFQRWYEAPDTQARHTFLMRLERKGRFSIQGQTYEGELYEWHPEKGLCLSTPHGKLWVSPGHLHMLWPSS
uniref:BirA family transcriptional regulator, biotin operon repressor / biotin-[acetyl-CoA-carboxylase] ligase n=1 Tax=uncultured Bacteroidota bacterium TaxID=152509 RepID=H5SK31_9BACT|nr:BirA family transcriptional regulator, biotin operon repressor / biotin-[acetyl-CoA-carboxylase] ligase [uncultured Bacteroidetes bacterium]